MGPIFMTTSNPNYFLKAPSPNTITLGNSPYEFGGGDTNIQSTAMIYLMIIRDSVETAGIGTVLTILLKKISLES